MRWPAVSSCLHKFVFSLVPGGHHLTSSRCVCSEKDDQGGGRVERTPYEGSGGVADRRKFGEFTAPGTHVGVTGAFNR